MRSQALPLLLRLLLPLALLVLGAGSVRTALLWRDEVVLGSLRTQQFVDDFQRLYAPRLAELHASGNDSALRDLLRASVTRYPELARVTWRGQDGLAVVVSGVPVVLGVPSWVQWLQTVPGMPNALRDSQRRQTLLHQGREHGTLEISISSATEMNRIWKSVRTQIWTVAGVLAVLLANHARRQAPPAVLPAAPATPAPGLSRLLHEAMTDGAQLLLLGAMLIGLLTGEAGQAAMKPFSVDLFKGMLAFFLLDMGLLAARHMGQLRGLSPWLLVYALLGPLLHASLAWGLGRALGMSAGDTALLMVLAASASYIAVPAVVRHAIPEARPALYFGMSLGVTFPFNILAGIPLYIWLAHGP